MVEKTKPRGRPRAYDPDRALDSAAELFWAKGFEATSLDDLSAAMDMRRPSIYNAFGDKEALFLRALDRYRGTVGSSPLVAMQGIDDVGEAFRAFFAQVVNYSTADEQHLGCLLGSVAVATDSQRVREYLKDNLDGLQGELAERLAAGIAAGQLPAGYPVQRGARRAVDALISLATRARLGTPHEELRRDAEGAAAAVMAEA